eukprot:Filipodium_phascolosomae@DN6320_c0_g1_i1.p1
MSCKALQRSCSFQLRCHSMRHFSIAKVFVRGVRSLPKEDIFDVFQKVGPVKSVHPLSRIDGGKVGGAIVEFERAADAQRAVERLNGTSHHTALMHVEPYNEERDKPPPVDEWGATEVVEGSSGKQLFVHHSNSITQADLKEAFSVHGSVTYTRPIGQNGAALVVLSTKEEARKAVEAMNNTKHNGGIIRCKIDKLG